MYTIKQTKHIHTYIEQTKVTLKSAKQTYSLCAKPNTATIDVCCLQTNKQAKPDKPKTKTHEKQMLKIEKRTKQPTPAEHP